MKSKLLALSAAYACCIVAGPVIVGLLMAKYLPNGVAIAVFLILGVAGVTSALYEAASRR